MEIFGGFMVMMSIIGLFLAVVWLIMPFVVFAIKGKQDRTLEVLDAIERRLAAIEAGIQPVVPELQQGDPGDSNIEPINGTDGSSVTSRDEHPLEHTVTLTGSATEKNGPEASPAT